MAWQFRKKLWLPLAAGLSLSLSAASVFASEGVELEVGSIPTPAPTGSAPKADEDSKGLSEHLWQGSFDKAGDASREAELELRKIKKFTCAQADSLKESNPQAAAAAQAKCDAATREIREYSAEAGSIRGTQRIFSDVSKVSDLAAVGAIGATAYAQLGKRNPSQANSLQAVAEIQETAGYASYAAGATDFTMGAYAYAAQKSRFDDMEEKLRKAKAPANMISKVSAAAEATKQAAYSHMMYGAGKAAFGYASIYMAKQNRKQAEALSSLTPETAAVPAAPVTAAVPTISGSTGGGGGPVYNNNQPVFSTGDGKSLTTDTATSTNSSPVFASSGGSVLRASDLRGPASGSGSLGGGGGSLGPSSGASSGGGAGSAAPAAEEAEALTAAAEKQASYEINTLGGSPHYGGGSSKSSGGSEADALTSLLTNAIGGKGPESAATGVNPNQVYQEATNSEGEESQASEAGVNSPNRSLFEVMRTKYAKIIQGGRVLGPGAVEVRN